MTKETLNKIIKVIPTSTKNRGDYHHGLEHINNVTNTTMKIADRIDPDHKKIDRNLLEACVYSHEVAWTKYNVNLLTYFLEGILAKRILKELINDLEIDRYEKEILLEAVKTHPHSFPLKRLNKRYSIYSQILQDADTIDAYRDNREEETLDIYLSKVTKAFVFKLFNIKKADLDNYLNLDESKKYFYEINFLNKVKKDKNFSYSIWNEKGKKKILCIHGYADNSKKFSKLANELKNEYRIISLDLPTETELNKAFSVEKLAQYIETFCKENKINPDLVLGFSMGGLVGLEYSYKNNKPLLMLSALPSILPYDTTLKKLLILLKPDITKRQIIKIISLIKVFQFNSFSSLKKNRIPSLYYNNKTKVSSLFLAFGYNGINNIITTRKLFYSKMTRYSLLKDIKKL
jgi:hypothetical protein